MIHLDITFFQSFCLVQRIETQSMLIADLCFISFFRKIYGWVSVGRRPTCPKIFSGLVRLETERS